MEAREDLGELLLPGLLVLLLDDLRVVLEDVCKALRREEPLPEVLCLQSVGVRGVARAIVKPLVKR